MSFCPAHIRLRIQGETIVNRKLQLTAIAAVLTMLAAPMTASAKKPHPISDYPITVDSCVCDEWVFVDETVIEDITVPAHWTSACDAQWTTLNVPAPLTYGASVEYEAQYMVETTEIEMESETEVEEYSCALGDHDGGGADDDERCTAADVPVSAPVVGDPAEQSLELKVKGFVNGKNGKYGKISRDFVKDTGSCTPLPPTGVPVD